MELTCDSSCYYFYFVYDVTYTYYVSSSQEWVIVSDKEVFCLSDAEKKWEGKGERHETVKGWDNKHSVRERREQIKTSV